MQASTGFMAKIRAYKLAEELGIERGEFVEKAKALGVELRSPMVGLEADVADQLREKLGGRAAARPSAGSPTPGSCAGSRAR